jgi:hypothetical protein
MTATNHTEHYELSQFAETDRPTWSGDYNGDMAKIDGQMKKNADAIQHVAENPGITQTAADQRYLQLGGLTNTNTAKSLKTEIDGKAPKTASQPGTLGLTAKQLDNMFADENGIVRVGNKN